MTGMEIFLIMVGIVAIIGSFVFSDRLENADKSTENGIDKLSEENFRKKVDEAVDNILDEKVEATEVKIEKIMNEKIMTVGEYSENVISDISKNHDEVMFLYGMLNDKEKDIKKTVIDVENLKKSIKQDEYIKPSKPVEAEGEEQEYQKKQTRGKKAGREVNKTANKRNEKDDGKKELKVENHLSEEKDFQREENRQKNSLTEKNKGVAVSAKEVKAKSNNNQKILELYEKGKTSVEIAKELKLGVGEVRLVIDLYKNR